tara:strand:- start:248 stop:1348 length:1101 start_codon:yes stop_codon:yes gene_type:complete
LAILPLVRPEGLSVSVGFGLLFLAFAHIYRRTLLRKSLLIAITLMVLLITILTIWRLNYFGYPVPNTFYAKLSTNYLTQIFQGGKYFARYLLEPIIAVQILLAFGLIAHIYTFARQSFQYTNWLAIVWLCAFSGIVFLYIVLGGDHFGSFRQFQTLTPLLSSLASVSVAKIFYHLDFKEASMNNIFGKQILIGCITFGALIIFVPSVSKYAKTGGRIDHEFRIAEEQRALGNLLNQLPSSPSLGVIAAGGISRTYDGHIFDLMGLNWTSMAHSNRIHNFDAAKNHAAFSKEVFFDHYPDIIAPSFGACAPISDDKIMGTFLYHVLDGIFFDERFKTVYVQACYEEATFYIKKHLSEEMNSILRFPE